MSLTVSTPLVINDIDDYLGPGTSRFFGSGYRGTNPQLRRIAVRHDGPGPSRLDARGSISVGGLWSIKGTEAQQPHLGTTDAIVLALECTQALLASRYSPGFLPNSYVKHLTIAAGNAPIEETLDDFPVSAETRGSVGGVITVNVQLGSMKASVGVHHRLGVPSRANLATETIDALVGESCRRVYGEVYRSRQPGIRNITIARERRDAQATLSVARPATEPDEYVGLEADYQPGLSLVESFVSTLQLGQVLLYELDGLTRADSNTLWMRKTAITAFGPPPGIRTDLPLNVQLHRERILFLNGDRWRCADIVGRVGDHIEISCTVAHQIPPAL